MSKELTYLIIVGVALFIVLMIFTIKAFIKLFNEEMSYKAVVESISLVKQHYSSRQRYTNQKPEHNYARPRSLHSAARNEPKGRIQIKEC